MTKLTPEEDAQIDRDNAYADKVLDEILDDAPDDVDVVGVAYGLWVSLTRILVEAGWNLGELTRDLVHHHDSEVEDMKQAEAETEAATAMPSHHEPGHA